MACLLTDAQKNDLSNNNLSFFTHQHRHDYDEHGSGILHYLVNNSSPLNIFQQALDLGLSPHTFNIAYKSPIDLAIENDDIDIAIALLQQPLRIDDDYLGLILGAAVSEYQKLTLGQETEKKAIIGFFASRLCGVNVHEELNKNAKVAETKYKGHLYWLKGQSLIANSDLEGFHPITFLPLRVRTMFELYVQIYQEEVAISEAQLTETRGRQFYLDEIRSEIARDLQTYFVLHYGVKIQNCGAERLKLLSRLHKGIIEAIKQLDTMDSIVLETGWEKHTTYLVIKKTEENYQMTLHNLGAGSDCHPKDPQGKVFPYLLALLKKNSWDEHQSGFNYLSRVIELSFPESNQITMQPFLYNKVGVLAGESVTGLNHTFLTLPLQIIGNCVVANHDASQSVTFNNPSILKFVQLQERKIAAELGPIEYYPDLPIELWKIPLKLLPIYISKKLQMIKPSDLNIVRKIGEGGFAEVYLGQWQGSDVAFKRLKYQNLPRGILTSFQTESEIHSRCNQCPQIVRLFGITNEPGHFGLVMEYLPRGSLYDVLNDRSIKLPWEKRWEIAIDIANAVAYLHRVDVLHKDIKSTNLLMTEQLRAKITDFGQSEVRVHTAHATRGGMGVMENSIRWNPPEAFKHDYRPSRSTDVYSVGMVFWELASRALPFMHHKDDVVIMRLLEDGYRETIPDDCPQAYAQIIQETWKSAEERPLMDEILKMVVQAKSSINPPEPDIVASANYQGENEYFAGMDHFIHARFFKALECFKKSATLEHPAAYLRLVFLYDSSGFIGSPQKAEAEIWRNKAARHFQWFKSQAEKGGADSQRNLGYCYYYGIGVEKDYAQAVEWYQKSAEQGYTVAQSNLAGCYSEGIGVTKNADKSIEWNRKSAEQGFAIAQYNLAHELLRREAFALSKDWLLKAFEQGYSAAESFLGMFYLKNYGINLLEFEKDNTKAVELFQKAAEKGWTHAIFMLSICYSEGIGVQIDIKKAEEYCKQASQDEAQFAEILSGKIPIEKIIELLHTSAKIGNTLAQFQLGIFYEYEKKDLWEASVWYSKAAIGDNPDAQYKLGEGYFTGHIFPKNKTEAFKWLEKAAFQDHLPAMCKLGICYENGYGITKNKYIAVSLYRQAAEKDNTEAQINLGRCYEKGIGNLIKSWASASQWYMKANELGDPYAERCLAFLQLKMESGFPFSLF